MPAHPAKLELSIYYPLDTSNPDTWTLYLSDPATQTSLHRIVYPPGGRSHHALVEARYNTHPREVPRYKERLMIGYVDADQVAKARRAIQEVKVRYSHARASKDWVMDVLKVLEEMGVLGFEWRAKEWLEYHFL